MGIKDREFESDVHFAQSERHNCFFVTCALVIKSLKTLIGLLEETELVIVPFFRLLALRYFLTYSFKRAIPTTVDFV